MPDMEAVLHPPVQPRAIGQAFLSAKRRGSQTVLDDLHQAGSLKVLFPQPRTTALTGVLLNTAGGITGGDVFTLSADTGDGGQLTLTTTLTVQRGGCLHWLPQETLLYNGAALERRLQIDMAEDARLLMVEPLVFGRAAMGEVLSELYFTDHIDLTRAGAVIFADRTRLTGDAATLLQGRATGAAHGAMASVLYAAPDAEVALDDIRSLLPASGGVSLVHDNLLFVRLLAPDSFVLRQTLDSIRNKGDYF